MMSIDIMAPWLIVGVGGAVALFALSRRDSPGAGHLIVSGTGLAAFGGYLLLKPISPPLARTALAVFVVLLGAQLIRSPRSRLVRDPGILLALIIAACIAALELMPDLSATAQDALLWTVAVLTVIFLASLVMTMIRGIGGTKSEK